MLVSIKSILSLCATVNSENSQKIRKVIMRKTPCINSWAHCDPKTWKQDLSQKNSFKSALSLYALVTLCEKSEKFWASLFHKTSKTSFWAYYICFNMYHGHLFDFEALGCSNYWRAALKWDRHLFWNKTKYYYEISKLIQ